jgi:hypothetical protein
MAPTELHSVRAVWIWCCGVVFMTVVTRQPSFGVVLFGYAPINHLDVVDWRYG